MGSSTSTATLLLLIPFVAVAVDIVRRVIQSRIERKGYPLPPGPTPFPVLGNVLSVDKEHPWVTYTEWRAKYGDIMHLRLLDLDVIVLNSASVANDLLEKRSQTYSDRPFIATLDPYGHDCNFAFARYSDRWRLFRRIFRQTFRTEAALAFRPMQVRRARQMIISILDHPERYPSHFATFASAVVMSAVYGYEPSPLNDPWVSTMENFLHISVPAITTEKAIIVKIFPFLLNVPDWFPGSWIKREAKEAYAWRNKLVNTPYQYVEERMKSGDHTVAGTMVADHINRMGKLDDSSRPIYENTLKHTSASAIIGNSILMTFTLAMVENPRVWKRAQEDIDAIIGLNKLPEFDDRSRLPYVDAIIRETLRWMPVGPLGLPHASINSDVYRNYYIPKGAAVIANIWAMSRDQARYPDPEEFIPERFLHATEGIMTLTDDDPARYIFGFGRRLCPGQHVADASLWSSIAIMLATLDFNRAKDADENDVTFTATWSSGVTLHPNPFPCELTPRAHVSKEYLEPVL